jgi:Zn-dependent peptidase ImmA (M78 family)
MTPERSQEIAGLADAVAEMYSTASRTIDPAEVARAVGLTYSTGRYGDCFDGLLEWNSSRFHIYLNKDLGSEPESPRGRFTLCHELGHFCLEEHRWALMSSVAPHGSLTDFRSDNAAEREADMFASNLLLPTERVRKTVGARDVGAPLIVETARHFGASLSATAIRIARLGLSPLIVMAWDGEYRRWCWSSADFEAITRNMSYRSLEKIPSDSLTREFITRGPLLEGAVDAKGTTLGTWFPRIHPLSPNNTIMVEEVIGLGRFGVMTVLRPDK